MDALGKLKGFAIGTAMALASMSASAIIFDFSNEFSGSGDVCANTTCATLEVTQNNGGVDFVLTADLADGEFITGLYGNRDPYADSVESNVGGTTEADVISGATFETGLNAFKADGDGDFDWLWTFNSNPPRLDGTETFMWTFANTSLDDIINAVSQDGPVGKTGFTFALRVQGLGENNAGSGFFNSDDDGGDDDEGGDDDQIPEPASLALVGLALLAAGAARRRRKA